MELTRDEILARLPHRAPILMPHRVLIEIPGERGVGQVRPDPQAPLWNHWTAADLDRELVLESAAQVLGLVLGSNDSPGDRHSGRHLLLGFADVQFSGELNLTPGLDLAVRVTQRVGGICRGRFEAFCGGVAVACGELTVLQEQ